MDKPEKMVTRRSKVESKGEEQLQEQEEITPTSLEQNPPWLEMLMRKMEEYNSRMEESHNQLKKDLTNLIDENYKDMKRFNLGLRTQLKEDNVELKEHIKENTNQLKENMEGNIIQLDEKSGNLNENCNLVQSESDKNREGFEEVLQWKDEVVVDKVILLGNNIVETAERQETKVQAMEERTMTSQEIYQDDQGNIEKVLEAVVDNLMQSSWYANSMGLIYADKIPKFKGRWREILRGFMFRLDDIMNDIWSEDGDVLQRIKTGNIKEEFRIRMQVYIRECRDNKFIGVRRRQFNYEYKNNGYVKYFHKEYGELDLCSWKAIEIHSGMIFQKY